MSVKGYFKLYLIISIVSWLALVIGDLLTLYSLSHVFDFYLTDFWRNVLLTSFFLFTFLLFKINIGQKKSSNFIEMLWQVFIFGATTILISLLVKFMLFLFGTPVFKKNLLFNNLIYHFNIALVTVFLANGFYVWKKMILYQKSKQLNMIWLVFELLALLSMLTNFAYFDIFNFKIYLYAIPLFLFGMILSFNLKWVAFLNYKQKWQSILLIVLIIVIGFTFLQQIYEQHFGTILIIDLAQNLFIGGVSSFILLNCFSALLVLLFNLPTSSVFEQKFGEVMIFQKLSQSIQLGNKEDEVHEILIDSSLSTIFANAGWLEIVDEKGNFKAFINKGISEIDVFEIKKVLRKNHFNIDNQPQYIKDAKSLEHSERIQKLPFKSLLIIPLYSHKQKLGTLVLLKNETDGFDKEMVDIICSFVSQASIAIKNFRLIDEAVATERYQEELKIAKEVQKSLLPQSLIFNINLQITAFTKAADEVGGDYYDFYEYSDKKIAMVIGDVSGNGTSAAFTMAQMKGVFQSLVQTGIPPDEFMVQANKALGRGLEKSSFITLTFLSIDTENQTIEIARAGHCPALFFNSHTGEISYLKSKGLGLGIIRNKDYSKHIEKKKISYNKGDILILYTDGIIEATNELGEEFGFDKLKNLLYIHHGLNTKEISNLILEKFYEFTGTQALHDDYTFLIIKFV
ncbi:MAG: SpoIIE family protein phosphatase [Sporocytophaga sp.]|nr:SpoIIE family protein phosphatase [Sporocytophaga sp.]